MSDFEKILHNYLPLKPKSRDDRRLYRITVNCLFISELSQLSQKHVVVGYTSVMTSLCTCYICHYDIQYCECLQMLLPVKSVYLLLKISFELCATCIHAVCSILLLFFNGMVCFLVLKITQLSKNNFFKMCARVFCNPLNYGILNLFSTANRFSACLVKLVMEFKCLFFFTCSRLENPKIRVTAPEQFPKGRIMGILPIDPGVRWIYFLVFHHLYYHFIFELICLKQRKKCVCIVLRFVRIFHQCRKSYKGRAIWRMYNL